MVHYSKKKFSIVVIVAALGYFVDIYDLVLFSIVRVPSLKSLGVADEQLLTVGVSLINWQMFGMLLGGLLWGILGDKRGRLSVLFGSILLYSLANIANGLVYDITWYSIFRFIAGIGLAGELGAGITLVSEVMPKETRGYGTTIVASVGICGAILAAQIAKHFDWRVAYFIGGGLGLALLVLRVGVAESGLFDQVKQSPVQRGDFLSLFKSREQFAKYLKCIVIALPTWFVVGILITFIPEFAQAKGLTISVNAGDGIMFCYAGLAVGDLMSGLISQLIKSRKKVVFGFLIFNAIMVAVYLLAPLSTSFIFYSAITVLGFSVGYWAMFVTIASEQFGTNIRATVTTTAPNFVRGALVPVSTAFALLKLQVGIIHAALIIGAVTIAIAIWGTFGLDETFGRDLNFVEESQS